MSHAEKSAYYQELKAAGVNFDKSYQQYTTEELRDAVTLLRQRTDYVPPEPEPAPQPQYQPPLQAPQQPQAPTASRPADPVAGQHAYQAGDEDTPIRVDPETGFIWYREEVPKPAYAKGRKRRVLTYLDPGSVQQTVKNGEYIETFEVAGTQTRTSEVKITLPSYQVGVYKDPKLPFKIHVYNGNRGFDLFDVRKFYGSPDLVPAEIKTVYIENDLCYDIRTTVRAIQQEYRNQQLRSNLS